MGKREGDSEGETEGASESDFRAVQQQARGWKVSACIISASLLIHVCWVHCSYNINENASTYVMARGARLK